MFGTFHAEGEQAIYGITKPVNSFNPVFLVFHVWIDIFKQMGKTSNFIDKIKYLFASPVDPKALEPSVESVGSGVSEEKVESEV